MMRPMTTNHPLTAVHTAALEAMRDTAAPIDSHWRSRSTGEVWRLIERTGATVLLQLPGTRRHKSGLLHSLLTNYTKETPCN
jgi:hypothetical protein